MAIDDKNNPVHHQISHSIINFPFIKNLIASLKTGLTQTEIVIATETECREAIAGFWRLRRLS